MATRKLSLAVIRRTVSALPGVEEGTSYGTPAWRHKGKLLARLHQDGQSIVLKVGNETRDHLLQADPETFFVTDHYLGYPMVLAHLDRLSAADLKKLLDAPCCHPEQSEGFAALQRRPRDKRQVRRYAQDGIGPTTFSALLGAVV